MNVQELARAAQSLSFKQKKGAYQITHCPIT